MTSPNELPIKCPFCPMCGTPPPWIFDTMAQAFCINEDCDVLAWSPWDSASDNLRDMREATVTSEPMPDFGTTP